MLDEDFEKYVFSETASFKGISPTHTSKRGNLPNRESYIKSIFGRSQEHNSIVYYLKKWKWCGL